MSDEAPESSGWCLMDARDQILSKKSGSGGTQARGHSMLLQMHWKKSQKTAGTAKGLELGLGLGITPAGVPGATSLVRWSVFCCL